VTAEREALRARLFQRALLPLTEVVLAERDDLARSFRGTTAVVQLEVAGCDDGAALRFRDGRLRVEAGVWSGADVRLTFSDHASLNAFFSGRPALPRVRGLQHAVLLARVGRLLASLRLLQPAADPGPPATRALRVKLLLELAGRGLAQLHLGGFPPMVELVRESPERVYQWSVEREGLGMFLRMERGRVKAGRGTYARRRPFVQFAFPDVEAAHHVLTQQGSQMDSVRRGLVRPLGSPEYTRKIGLMMQKLDELLQEG
jgi:hypothetical protein